MLRFMQHLSCYNLPSSFFHNACYQYISMAYFEYYYTPHHLLSQAFLSQTHTLGIDPYLSPSCHTLARIHLGSITSSCHTIAMVNDALTLQMGLYLQFVSGPMFQVPVNASANLAAVSAVPRGCQRRALTWPWTAWPGLVWGSLLSCCYLELGMPSSSLLSGLSTTP